MVESCVCIRVNCLRTRSTWNRCLIELSSSGLTVECLTKSSRHSVIGLTISSFSCFITFAVTLCVSAALVSVAKVMCCIQCCLVCDCTALRLLGMNLGHFTGCQRSLLCKPCTSHRRDVCLSVSPSITRWHWVKTTQARTTKSLPTDSAGTLVFQIKNSSRNSKGFTPKEGVKWG